MNTDRERNTAERRHAIPVGVWLLAFAVGLFALCLPLGLLAFLLVWPTDPVDDPPQPDEIQRAAVASPTIAAKMQQR
jgi:hypothetical protein